MHELLVFTGVAVLVTLTPGPATAMVVRSALRGGRRDALRTTLGNSIGVLFWGFASAVGISALVAASEVAFVVLKVAGAVVLVSLGVQAFVHSRQKTDLVEDAEIVVPTTRAFRDGLVTSLANPKLAIFFVALFPQFIPKGDPVLPRALGMSVLIVALDLVWYSVVALAVTRAQRVLAESMWPGRLERITGGLMVGLGLRLALEAR
ncbi:MAG TPA: LysE family translocator [Gaiellaceae bacterium]|nr:LysE family translocator [Gaiellaceae bacterium]